MRFKAALFDLDGTLLDSVPVILRTAREVFDVMDLPFDEDRVRRSIGIPLKVQALDWAGARALEFEECYRVTYRRNQHGDFQLFPHTLDMLGSLKSQGTLTALVTSKSATGATTALERTGMARFFDAVVSADDVTHPKPEPEPLLKALDILGASRDQSVYVGDSSFDVDCAQRAEVMMAAMSWGARTRDDLLLMCPNRVFDSWPEFLEWMGRDPLRVTR